MTKANNKISAIICEFNPLHTGHKRLIDYAKSISQKVVCIMSGNFTQRGLPACANKYDRAKHAILAGADMVVELPTIFATASAQNFAFGGVTIANQLGCDYLVFGSECGDVCQLQQCAKMLDEEQVNLQIKQNVQNGLSYPAAVSKAVGSNLLDSPNNLLAIEYLRALNLTNSKMIPLTITREDNYDCETSTENFASSKALRKDLSLCDKYSFDFVKQDIDVSIIEKYQAYSASAISIIDANQWQQIEGVSEGIENRFISATKNLGYDNLLEQVKTKRYTRAKLQRIMLNAVLGITKQDVALAKQNKIEVKVLAIKSDFTWLLKYCDEQSTLTTKADNLFATFTNYTPPTKLQKF